MSDTVLSTAPVQAPVDPIEEGARRLAAARTAAPATPDQQASPEAVGSTAPSAQSQAQPALDTPEGTEVAPEGGEPEAEQQPPEDADPIAFRLDDGTPVKASEARQGYLRQQDYSRKTEMLVQGRDTLVQVLQDTIATRETAAKLIESTLPPLDDNLRYTDPGVWTAQKIERFEAIQRVAQLRAENNVDLSRLDEQDAHVAQQEMPRALPHWSDRAVMLREQELARRFVAEQGYPESTVAKITRDPWLIRAVIDAAKHKPVRDGAAKGGAAAAANRPSPSIAQAQVRPAPVGTAAQRQQQQSLRSGEAVRTQPRPMGGLRTRFDQGASRLKPLPVRA